MNQDHALERLAAIESRLANIERGLAESEHLRAALQHEVDCRRQLAEQAAYLLEQLGDARRQLKALQDKRG